jgi:hypothetical protein
MQSRPTPVTLGSVLVLYNTLVAQPVNDLCCINVFLGWWQQLCMRALCDQPAYSGLSTGRVYSC